MRIAICDSDYGFTAPLENLLYIDAAREGLRIETEVFTRGECLLDALLMGETYDLFFLERHLPDISGVTLGKSIRSILPKTTIIYHSSFLDHMEELFEVEAFRFLKKPLQSDLLYDYFSKACARLNDGFDSLIFKDKTGQRKLPYREVAFFESDLRKIRIHRRDGSEECFYGKLDELEQTIRTTHYDFLRIHQSYLVNTSIIHSLAGRELMLIGSCRDLRLPVSTAHRADVKSFLSRLTLP